MTTETTITLVHAHFDPAHLEAVKAEMRVRGAPVIRVLDVAGELYAFEGCHRLRAAEALGLPVRIERLDYEGTIDLDTLDYDDYGWFDDRSAAPIAEVFERMHDAPEAYVRVAIADAD